MNKLIPFLLLIIIFTACNSSKKNVSTSYNIEQDSTITAQEYNHGWWPLYTQPACISCGDCYFTFYDNVRLYTQPDTTTLAADTLSFATRFERQYFTNYYFNQGLRWLRIKYKSEYYFIDREKLVFIEQHIDNPDYSDHNTILGITKDTSGYEQLTIKSYDTATRKNRTLVNLPYVSTFHLSKFHSSTLDDYNYLIYYRSSRESCPGTTYEAVLTKWGDLLAEGWSEGESGYYDITNIYLPMRAGDDSIILATYVEPNNYHYNPYYSGQYHTIPYPKDIGVPIEQLIVIHHEAADMEDNGQAIREDTYLEEPIYIYKDEWIYYQWNGEELKKIDYSKKK